MKNRWKRAWEALGGNGGSGIVLVLVAISCITLMTSSLMLLSYTSYKMKAAERQNKAELYEADAKMDVLFAKIQKVVSDAIAVAQQEVFETYKQFPEQNNTKFKEVLLDELSEKFGGAGEACNIGYFNTLLGDTDVFITGDASSKCKREGFKVVVRNINITYRSQQSDNFTTIKTDIIMDVGNLNFDIGSAWDIESTVKLENWSVN